MFAPVTEIGSKVVVLVESVVTPLIVPSGVNTPLAVVAANPLVQVVPAAKQL
jgi:hypothetical protein